MRYLVFTVATIVANASNPCEQLCQRDGPSLCTGGSFPKPGRICHAYLLKPSGEHCYHTSQTRATCPGSLPALSVDAAARLVGVFTPTASARPSEITTTTQSPSDRPDRLHPIDIQSVANDIGSAYYSIGSRNDWSRLCGSIASHMSRLPDLARRFISQSDADDFWTRSNGGAILASALAADNFNNDRPHEGLALILLISHMPWPTDQDEALAFMIRQGIHDFIDSNTESLARYLLRSQMNLGAVVVPEVFHGRLDIRGMGLLYSFAVNWRQRFPQIIAARPGLSRLVLLHALNLQRCSEPIVYDLAFFTIHRRTPLQSSTNELLRASVSGLRRGFLDVRFVGESAIGDGLRNEWFTLMDTAIQGSVFKQRADSVVSQVDPADTTTLDNLRAVGRYFALCIIHGRPTGLNLPVGFFKMLAGRQVGLEDSLEIDEGFYRGMRHYVGEISLDEFEALTYGMEDEPLAGSGATEPLTMANKDAQVVMAVENLIMNQNRTAFNALVDGFTSVIPQALLANFDAAELRGFICGNIEIDPVSFFNNIDFKNRTADWTAEKIEWIREIITGFNQERLSKLLRFVTGFQILPAGGFPAFGRIAFDAFPVTQVRYPTAHTCLRSLDMPIYASLEETREILTNVVDLGNFADMAEAVL